MPVLSALEHFPRISKPRATGRRLPNRGRMTTRCTIAKPTTARRPANRAEEVTLEIDGRRHRAEGTSVMRAAASSAPIPKLCATDSSTLRLLPPVPGRDRGAARAPGLVHHAGRRPA
jgi:hypothetical protein